LSNLELKVSHEIQETFQPFIVESPGSRHEIYYAQFTLEAIGKETEKARQISRLLGQ
jgi:hypothetical protein